MERVHSQEQLIYYRLIALWVVCEALLGGIIHGFRIPVSGLVVGSSAVICICLIAHYVPGKGAILRATLIVAIFKMMLSPHSPLTAYVAVFFQGLVGELLFFNRRNYKASCVALGIIALMESGIQRILVMTIIYGQDLWTAFDEFIYGFTKQWTAYSTYLIGTYLLFHLITGILVGWFAAHLPRRAKQWNVPDENMIIGQGKQEVRQPGRKKNVFNTMLFIVWLILIFIFLYSLFWPALLPNHLVLHILLRSVLIVLTWYFVISPLLTVILKKWLQQQKQQLYREVSEIVQLLPATNYIMQQSWQMSASRKGIRRLTRFFKIVLVNTLPHD